MRVNQSVLFRAVTWLLKHQGSQGEFSEKGSLIHTEMQAGLDDAPVALTAYVLMTLLEDESYAVGPDATTNEPFRTSKNYCSSVLCVGQVPGQHISGSEVPGGQSVRWKPQ